MKNYIQHNEWSVIETGYHAQYNLVSESLMSLGNGSMGLRGNFEENFSGPSLQGTYVAGVYYPDKTRVGWWKNGYPEYFAKVLNNVNWIGLHLKIDDETLDLNRCEILEFKRELNLQQGILHRSFKVILRNGIELGVKTRRFCSMAQMELGCLQYDIEVNKACKIEILSYLDFDVKNQDSNYDEKFWEAVEKGADGRAFGLVAKTLKTNFHVAATAHTKIVQGNKVIDQALQEVQAHNYSGQLFSIKAAAGETIAITKTCAILSSLNHAESRILQEAFALLGKAITLGFDTLEKQHIDKWAAIWETCDIQIEGDIAAQQGIRFNIFQLYQTYTGHDARLNIGPKGFTGEKYGGSTYWDTEAYCLPFYLATTEPHVAHQLLMYRYRHLSKAIENAEKLGFKNGAALYPMVTINGEECHNEWEITFEEIHRNGAIAHAIYNYSNYTGSNQYLFDYGLEVLVGIARFWAQRVNWSAHKQQYVMLGVTGPNEFENNVNNNWYTNYLACWCLRYTLQALQLAQDQVADKHAQLLSKLNLGGDELEKWQHIVDKMYYPKHPELPEVVLQQDGFLDKELIPVSDLSPAERPIVEHWSWDRILRSVYIKQGDVLQGMYFLEHEFETETIRKNFEFYEPYTVHESSLSPCIHAVLAAKIGNEEKAYEYYLRTSRLDLDDYNNDTKDGCHITSMAGSWLAVVQGFAGMRVRNNAVAFNPFIPKQWKSYTFRVYFRGVLLSIKVTETQVAIHNMSEGNCRVEIYGRQQNIAGNETFTIPVEHAAA
ncbi:glycoside hydrolase family 65 protein [bacterium]|nr:glycoside hydrolase family 65 protein [bacterium]